MVSGLPPRLQVWAGSRPLVTRSHQGINIWRGNRPPCTFRPAQCTSATSPNAAASPAAGSCEACHRRTLRPPVAGRLGNTDSRSVQVRRRMFARTRLAASAALLFAACSDGGAGPTEPLVPSVIELSVSAVQAEWGDTLLIAATVRDQKGALLNAPLTWSSSNEAVLRSLGNGRYLAAGAGDARVVAKAGAVTAEAAATIAPQVPTTLALARDTATLELGDTLRLVATVRDRNGRTIASPSLVWSSTAPSVVQVVEGRAHALTAGSAAIEVRSGEVAAKATLTVLPPAAVVLAGKTLSTPSLGADLLISGHVRGGPVAAFRFERMAESRWLGEHAVLDSARLAAGTLRANAPGSTRLLVYAANSTALPDTLHVTVAPEQPVVFSVAAAGRVGGDETVTVRAYRANGLGTVRVSPALDTPATVSADSATLVLRPGTAPASAACSGTGESRLQFESAVTVISNPAFARARTGEVRLAVGDSLRLSAAQAACLRLAADGDAFYALAFYDPQVSADHRVAKVPYDYRVQGNIAVALADRSVPGAAGNLAAAMAQAAAPAAAPPSDFHASPPPHHFWERDKAFAVGDTLSYMNPYTGNVAALRVLSVVDGYWVLATPDSAVSRITPELLARLDSVALLFRQHGEPLLRYVLGDTLPTSNNGATQLLVLVEVTGDHGGVGGYAGYRSFQLGIGTTARYSTLLRVFAHEAAHVWAAWWRGIEADRTGAWHRLSYWSTEGLADALAAETLRRYYGYGFTANTDWRSLPPAQFNIPLWQEIYNTRGLIEFAYYHSAGLMRDLATRLVLRGMSTDDALRLVVRGSLEGYYGCGERTCPFMGLERRMQQALGADWKLADGMLVFAASYGLDDLNPSPTFQVPFVKWPQQVPGSNNTIGWRPHAHIVAGSGASGGGAIQLGAASYFYIEDGVGGSFSTTSSVPVEWLLVRAR
jgi:hypothetical protein